MTITPLSRRRFLTTSLIAATAVSAPWVRRAGASDPIRIGVVTPLSGGGEFIGNFVRNGAEVAVKMINEDGGVNGREMALEFRDSRLDPAAATAAARELIAAGVNLQMGTISSAVALAMGPLMESENGVVLTSGAGTERLNHENYSSHVFRVGDGPYGRNTSFGRLAAERYSDITEWTGIIPDHEYGRTTWRIFVDGMMNFFPEAKIHDPFIVPFGASNYNTQIQQMMRSPARGIYNSTYGGDSITLFQQALPFGLFRDRVLLDSANEFIVANALGANTPPHWTGSHWFHETNADIPLSQRFHAEYVAHTGEEMPMGWAGEAQAGIAAYAAAIARAGSTETAAVIEALKGLTIDTVTGPRLIRAEDNQAVKDVELMYIEPDADAPRGFRVSETIRIDGEAVVEPPSPGTPMELRSPA
ncbi:MAG: ABC transporter substrate-binding protein [Alkalilacustris sp.]